MFEAGGMPECKRCDVLESGDFRQSNLRCEHSLLVKGLIWMSHVVAETGTSLPHSLPIAPNCRGSILLREISNQATRSHIFRLGPQIRPLNYFLHTS